jgi:hypothetical protein
MIILPKGLSFEYIVSFSEEVDTYVVNYFHLLLLSTASIYVASYKREKTSI